MIFTPYRSVEFRLSFVRKTPFFVLKRLPHHEYLYEVYMIRKIYQIKATVALFLKEAGRMWGWKVKEWSGHSDNAKPLHVLWVGFRFLNMHCPFCCGTL